MKPTFVLVAGSWHTAACYDALIKALADAGYPSIAVNPRCLNSSPPAASFQPDADALKDVLAELQDKDVIIVMHSYAGIVGTDAVGALVATQPNIATRIKRLVYLAAFVPLSGESLVSMVQTTEGPSIPAYFEYDDGYLVLQDIAADIFYHDVPEPERSRYVAMLGKHPLAANTSTIEHVGYEHAPSTYVYTTLDRPLDLRHQKFMVERVRSWVAERIAAGEALAEPFSGELGEFSIETGHSAMIVRPVELAGILGRIAEGTQGCAK